VTTWFRRLIAGLRGLARRRRDDRDLDDELQQYFETSVDAKIAAGLSEQQAIRAARAELGSCAAIEDDVHDVGWETRMLSIWDDVRYAVRGLRASRGFTLAVVITLGLGIGVNTAMFSMLDAVVLRKLPVPGAHELVALYENAPRVTPDVVSGRGRYTRFSYPRFLRLQQALGTHGSLAAMTAPNLFPARLHNGQRISVSIQLVSGNYFETFRILPARGRMLSPPDVAPGSPPVAVVSESFWKRQMGSGDDAVGQTIEIGGAGAMVVGVAPAVFNGAWMDDTVDVWLPLTLQPAIPYQGNTSSYGPVDPSQPFVEQDRTAWLTLVGRIGRSDRQLARTLLERANRLGITEFAMAVTTNPDERAAYLAQTLAIEPLARGFSRLRARQSSVLLALMGLVALVLLLTSANVATLLLVRGGRRRRETAVRVALGATRARIVRYVLTETLLLAGLGGLAGVLAAGWSRHVLAREIVGTSRLLPAGFSLDVRTLLFGMAASLLTAIVFGLVPAFRAARIGGMAAAGLNERQTSGLAAIKPMQSLVVLQLALSVVVVFSATLLSRSLLHLVRVDPGFAVEHLVSASFFNVRTLGYTGDRVTALADRLVSVADSVPGAASAAVSVCGLLAGCSYTTSVRLEGFDGTVGVYQNWVGPKYFSTVGLPLVRGREFDVRDTEHTAPVIIITESIARRYFQNRDPIGKRVSGLATGLRSAAEIVGVVGDLRPVSLRDAPVAMVFYPLSRRRADAVPTSLDLRVSGDPNQAVRAVREALSSTEPALTFYVTSMPMRMSQLVERDRTVAYLTSAFAGLALVLASVGLYGVLSFFVTQRNHEIGVRMALGAHGSEVLALIFKHGAALVVVGLALGLAAAPLAARSLQGMFFEVTTLDPVTFISVSTLMLVVGALAAILPARRATKVDPMVVLRSE
jgi:predicted permease